MIFFTKFVFARRSLWRRPEGRSWNKVQLPVCGALSVAPGLSLTCLMTSGTFDLSLVIQRFCEL